MICLRCGWCCKNLMVMVVDDPDLGLIPENIVFHPGDGRPCKHLRLDGDGRYEYAVYDREWYPRTPCAQYDQVGGGVCRVGQHVLTGGHVL